MVPRRLTLASVYRYSLARSSPRGADRGDMQRPAPRDNGTQESA